jgi:hypothetical protein
MIRLPAITAALILPGLVLAQPTDDAARCQAAAGCKRLRPLVPILLEAMERHGHVQLAPEVRARLLTMSAATIDRALRDIRRHRNRARDLCSEVLGSRAREGGSGAAQWGCHGPRRERQRNSTERSLLEFNDLGANPCLLNEPGSAERAAIHRPFDFVDRVKSGGVEHRRSGDGVEHACLQLVH